MYPPFLSSEGGWQGEPHGSLSRSPGQPCPPLLLGSSKAKAEACKARGSKQSRPCSGKSRPLSSPPSHPLQPQHPKTKVAEDPRSLASSLLSSVRGRGVTHVPHFPGQAIPRNPQKPCCSPELIPWPRPPRPHPQQAWRAPGAGAGQAPLRNTATRGFGPDCPQTQEPEVGVHAGREGAASPQAEPALPHPPTAIWEASSGCPPLTRPHTFYPFALQGTFCPCMPLCA